MSVIPCYHHLSKQDFKKLILACKQNKANFAKAEIITISKSIDKIDPLVFLADFLAPNQVSFYWENQRKQEAVVAIGSLKSLQVESGNRIEICQNFINELLPKIGKIGSEDLDNFPFFFSYFSFFNEKDKYNVTFPIANIFIPQLQLYKKENEYTLVINLLNDPQQEVANLLESYLDDIFTNKTQSSDLDRLSENVVNTEEITQEIPDTESRSFLNKVTQALRIINKRKLSKIVVSHALDISATKNYDIIATLVNLRKKHPDCYIFSLSNDHNDYFIGASPERLLSIQDHQLVTDALAGSAPRGKNDFDDQSYGEILLRSEKEQREHDAVSNFIIQRLSQLNLSPKKASLQLLKLSNIQHLWTPIYAEIDEDFNPLEILAQLHPTPAVAGVPLEIACAEIKNLEKFDRSLYAAPLGWIDTQGNCEFIVGIRSALIQGNKARLYAGAGLVYGSDPYQELAEIKLKFQAILQSLV